MRMRKARLVVCIAALLVVTGAQEQDGETPISRDLIHADLPLFGSTTRDKWPQHFSDGDSFGCWSRVLFGDWAYRHADDENDDDAEWLRSSNYGGFHCWANVSRADRREDLGAGDFEPSFFVFLGRTQIADRTIELWTIQMGVRPGSDYLLLAREGGSGGTDDEAIAAFDVLQTECPRANVRDGGSIEILIVKYCAINSRSELIHLAKRMAQRPRLGTLTYVGADLRKP